MTPDTWGRDSEAEWRAAAEANLGPLTTAPPLNLRDLAAQTVMADTLEELAQVVQAAINRFGKDALDLHCLAPGSATVLPLGTLIARRAGELTAS